MKHAITSLLRELAVALAGAIIAVLATHFIVRRTSQVWAWAALATAGQYQRTGDDDHAIILLAQATGIDPNFYGSFELLGDIYAKRAKRQVALEMYQKALDVFDREQFLSKGKINADEKDMIRSKIRALKQQTSQKQVAH